MLEASFHVTSLEWNRHEDDSSMHLNIAHLAQKRLQSGKGMSHPLVNMRPAAAWRAIVLQLHYIHNQALQVHSDVPYREHALVNRVQTVSQVPQNL